MDFDAIRRLLPPMSDVDFGTWLRRHVLGGIQEDVAADMLPAYYAALEVVRNSDERLDNMLRAVRDATQVNTLNRQLLVAHLEKLMDRLCIENPPTPPSLPTTLAVTKNVASSEGPRDDSTPGALDDLLVQTSPENRHALAFDNDAAVGGEAASTERWLVENRDALDSSNAFIEEHGLPLPACSRPSLKPRPLFAPK